MDTYGRDKLNHDDEHDTSVKDNSDQGNKLSNYLTAQFAIDHKLLVIMIHDGVMTAPDYD